MHVVSSARHHIVWAQRDQREKYTIPVLTVSSSCVVRALFLHLHQYVYELFAASVACNALVAQCSYSYFVLMWNKHCPHIKLKKAMRFTKCDVCTLASEALDQARRQGGSGWESEAMTTIKRTLEDHYNVRSITYLVRSFVST